MGAFNTLATETMCPNCRRNAEFTIQFKYGDTWQYRYSVGDRVKWGGNDIGSAEYEKVAVEGIAEEPCPHCGSQGLEFDVIVESGRIVKVLPTARPHGTENLRTFRVIP